ncbi:MAG: hypothetical protein SVU32_01330 [Candidatus Nanohaloarchaea archaeon]|nr:hypothetical protein [Candidatus Nanohaloarchaea archaeon]
MQRGASIVGKRALVVVTNRAVNQGNAVRAPRNYTAEAFMNGSINGTDIELMDENTFRDWLQKMVDQAQVEGYLINISVEPHRSFRVRMLSPFTAGISFQYNLSLRDPRIQTGFERTNQTFTARIPIEGLDDALILLETAGKKTNTYSRCKNPPARLDARGRSSEYNYTSNGSERNWTSGDAVVFNGNSLTGIDNRSGRILVTEDLCDYPVNDLEDFSGVVSEQETDPQDICGSGEEIPGYVGGINDSATFTNASRLVMTGTEVWTVFIPRQIERRCYFSDPEGPNFYDRLAGRLTGDRRGIASFLDIPDLPPEVQQMNTSAVDYVYFNESGSYGGVEKIKGVTGRKEWFRLDRFHVDYWNITALTYETR